MVFAVPFWKSRSYSSKTEPWATHAFWMYTLLLKDTVTKSRDEVMDLLDDQGIETRPSFTRCIKCHPTGVATKLSQGGFLLLERH